ncbi:MAG: hypothetical protein HN826_05705, partial [Methylococcales bacterium]|nr:hypothetical protein [Methylococcales bacterium]
MFYLILSFVTLVGSYFLLPTINPIIVEYRQIAEYALLAFIGISMLICIKFNRSRAFFQIFLLLIFLLSNKYYFNFTPKNLTDNAQLILLSLIFPINVVLFSFFKERGCFTIYGFFKFVFIASQVATFYWAINHQANWILQTSKISFIPNIGINFPFSDIIILNMLIGLLLLAIVFYRKRNALDVMILSLFI